MAGFAVYVGIYSLVMKRASAYSTVVGSLAGAAPPLAAYCAVTGRLDLGGLLVLAIFSLWQIPHSYAITIYRFKDYAAASLPVMPVRHGMGDHPKRHAWSISSLSRWRHSCCLFAAMSGMPTPASPHSLACIGSAWPGPAPNT